MREDSDSDVTKIILLPPKAEYLDLNEVKEELTFEECDHLITSSVHNITNSDTSSLSLGPSSDPNDESDASDFETSSTSFSKNDSEHDKINRKSRRKSSVPQRAVQHEITMESNSLGNSSESSQGPDLQIQDFSDYGNMLIDNQSLQQLNDNEDLLHDLNEVNIFKDLQEEADGEKLDEDILDNVKEEWRAHWGVKCNMCEQVFPFRTEFDKHYQESYGLIPVYTCTFCNKTAEKYSTFRSHCYRHITEGRYKCQECPKGFSLQSMLHVHVLAKHTKAKPFRCDECGKCFVTKPGLKIHLKKHKTEVKEDYPCVECGKILHTRGGLTSHMNVHRLGRRFMCDVCGKTFTQKVNMQQHVKQHTGDKPHGCDKCGKTFAERSHLARHYSFHSDQRPYKCEVCQKMYKTERCLKVHSLVHAPARPFICSYCNKGFLSTTKLKQHSNIHTGERPYKCKYCERTFTNYPNWLKHTRRRHKVDHKTGEDLLKLNCPNFNTPISTRVAIPKVAPKEELVVISPVVLNGGVDPLQSGDGGEHLITDISLSKSEELFLQQGILNFPLVDDGGISKFLIPQPMDFLGDSGGATSSGTTMGVLLPCFQNTLPGHHTLLQTNLNNHQSSTTSNLVTMQFSDLIHPQYLQQPLL